MSPSDPLSDNDVAFAAINLFANTPVGAEPDWQEIEDWHAGNLEQTRADEVLSHVANNPEVFQKWRDICEAAEFLEANPLADEVASEQSSTVQQTQTDASTNQAPYDLVGWIRKGIGAISNNHLPAIGGAVAAGFLAVMIVPKLIGTTPTSAGDMVGESLAQYSALGAPLPQTALVSRNTRSLAGVLDDLSEDDVVKHQLSHGLQQGFSALNVSDAGAFKPWVESLPTEPVDCSQAANSATCTDVSTDVATLGQWALVNHFACESGAKLPTEFEGQQRTSLAKLIELDTLNQNALLKATLPTKATLDSAQVCAVAGGLIGIASE